MRKLHGFTLIELLIVVAIIAILAAIAVPNFLEAQIRARVSTVKSDQRTLSTALESFQIDYNVYPKAETPTARNQHVTTINVKAPGSHLEERVTFANYRYSKIGKRYYTLTTPVSFIAELPEDVFAETNNAMFGYMNVNEMGWIAWSYGPDGDELNPTGSQLDRAFKNAEKWTSQKWSNNTVYEPGGSNPLPYLSDMTYDPTNGASSTGDVWKKNG